MSRTKNGLGRKADGIEREELPRFMAMGGGVGGRWRQEGVLVPYNSSTGWGEGLGQQQWVWRGKLSLNSRVQYLGASSLQ